MTSRYDSGDNSTRCWCWNVIRAINTIIDLNLLGLYCDQAIVTSVCSDARWRNRWRNRLRVRRAFWLVRRWYRSMLSGTRTCARSRRRPVTQLTHGGLARQCRSTSGCYVGAVCIHHSIPLSLLLFIWTILLKLRFVIIIWFYCPWFNNCLLDNRRFVGESIIWIVAYLAQSVT